MPHFRVMNDRDFKGIQNGYNVSIEIYYIFPLTIYDVLHTRQNFMKIHQRNQKNKE